MKRILTACLLGSIAFAASAQDVLTVAAEADVDADARAQVETDAKTNELDCTHYTGSRIAPRHGATDCIAGNGRTYSREDLESTGKFDVADALRVLDPAIR